MLTLFNSMWLSLSSVSVSRLMLGIRSLAAQLSLEPDWLLNNTELSRVNWKRGPRSGELIVEIDAIEIEDVELESIGHESLIHKRSHTPVIHVSRVGVLNHPVYPGTRDYKAPPKLPRKQRHGRVGFTSGESSVLCACSIAMLSLLFLACVLQTHLRTNRSRYTTTQLFLSEITIPAILYGDRAPSQ